MFLQKVDWHIWKHENKHMELQINMYRKTYEQNLMSYFADTHIVKKVNSTIFQRNSENELLKQIIYFTFYQSLW